MSACTLVRTRTAAPWWRILCTLALGTGIWVSPVQAQKMYWTNILEQNILRANLDGSDVEELIADLDAPLGIVLDLDGNKIYWANFGTWIYRANVDGSEVEDLFIAWCNMGRIALDEGAGKIYWTDHDFGHINGRIRRANLDGSDPETLVVLANPHDIAWDIELDLDGGKMYWNGSLKNIRRANLDGSQIEDLSDVRAHEIALDVDGGKIYWTELDANIIQRANLDGSNVEDIVTTGLIAPRGIALDVRAGKMYWTDPVADKIQRANLDGTNVEDLVGSGVASSFGITLGGESPPEVPTVSQWGSVIMALMVLGVGTVVIGRGLHERDAGRERTDCVCWLVGSRTVLEGRS